MKRILFMTVLILSVTLAGASYLRPSDEGTGAGSGGSRPGLPQGFGAVLDIGYCYDYLAPFGSWISLDPYGYVWCPRHMGYRWRPYADGYWIWTDYGWTWISDFEWGWMPFHYGRWGWDDDCGWFWVPGSIWGPSWVTWRWSDLYLGWAPIPPGIDFRAGMDFDSLSRRIPPNFWVFIGGSHFLDRNVRRFVLPHERNSTIVGYTKAQNNFEFRDGRLVNQGIDFETVRRATRHDVVRYRIADSGRPGETRVAGREAQIYRPSFRDDPGARPKAYLMRDQARRELAPAKIFEPRRQAPAAAPESTVRKRQAEERALLLKSQSQERKDMERRLTKEGRTMQSAAEKAKNQQDSQARITEQRRMHQAEQEQLNERHRRDAEQVRQAGGSREQAPPPKKK